jgi:hypothetical protein
VLPLALLPRFPKGNNTANTIAGFHKALITVFEPLKNRFVEGLDLDCADGFVRYCFHRLAA